MLEQSKDMTSPQSAEGSPQDRMSIFSRYPSRTLFIRDLPFSCSSHDLKRFVSAELNLPVVRAMVCDNKQQKTLHFGYVLLAEEEQVPYAIDRLHGFRFIGRDIKVQAFRSNVALETANTGSIHVNFRGLKLEVPLITEAVLRSFLESYGTLSQIVIRNLLYTREGNQCGYAFVSFNDSEADRYVVESVRQVKVNHVVYQFSWSRQHTLQTGNARSDGSSKVSKHDTTVDSDVVGLTEQLANHGICDGQTDGPSKSELTDTPAQQGVSSSDVSHIASEITKGHSLVEQDAQHKSVAQRAIAGNASRQRGASSLGKMHRHGSPSGSSVSSDPRQSTSGTPSRGRSTSSPMHPTPQLLIPPPQGIAIYQSIDSNSQVPPFAFQHMHQNSQPQYVHPGYVVPPSGQQYHPSQQSPFLNHPVVYPGTPPQLPPHSQFVSGAYASIASQPLAHNINVNYLPPQIPSANQDGQSILPPDSSAIPYPRVSPHQLSPGMDSPVGASFSGENSSSSSAAHTPSSSYTLHQQHPVMMRFVPMMYNSSGASTASSSGQPEMMYSSQGQLQPDQQQHQQSAQHVPTPVVHYPAQYPGAGHIGYPPGSDAGNHLYLMAPNGPMPAVHVTNPAQQPASYPNLQQQQQQQHVAYLPAVPVSHAQMELQQQSAQSTHHQHYATPYTPATYMPPPFYSQQPQDPSLFRPSMYPPSRHSHHQQYHQHHQQSQQQSQQQQQTGQPMQHPHEE